MAAVLSRKYTARSKGFRGRVDSEEEQIQLDFSKDAAQNMRDILVHVTRVKDERRALKLAYLNNFVRLCCYLGNQHAGFAREDILCCLRLGLLHQAKEIRTATLRALRYYIRDKQRLRALLSLQIDLLIVRSLDLVQDNEGERIQVLRLIRKMMSIDPATFPRSLLNAVVAIAGDGGHDRLVRCCLATICELAVYNPEVVARAGGVGVLMKCILDASMPGINEAMVATVLHLLNNPRTRPYIRNGVDIEQVLAPFTDFHYKHNSIAPDQEASESEDQELRFVACKQAIVTMLRSWPGMIRLCKKNDSGIRSVVKVLSLPYEDIRKHFIDVLFEVFRIPALEWTDDFSDALLSLDPSSMRDGWQLMEGFVVEEGLSILPHRASTRMNLVENYLSLLITAFVQAGLLEALVEVIISAGRSMAVATTILLGELLHVGNRLVPVEVSAYSQCLPTLTGLAASPNKSAEVRLRAREVVGYLKRLHDIKKRGVVPCSLYLDQILQLAPRALQTSSGSRFNPGHLAQTRLAQTLERDAEEVLTQAIKDSQVLVTKENFNWDWDLIAALLKWPGDGLVSIDRASGGKFVTRVSYFFSPRSMLFSTIDQGNDRAQLFSVTACYLLEFLLIHDEPEYQKILEDFLAEILDCLKEVCREHVTGSLVLSPQSLLSTLSRDYFLLIGRLSYSLRGEKALSRAGIFLRLMDLVSTTTHDVYVKLVVSSLSYNRSGIARTILSRILTGGTDSCRVYATQHLRVLLRAHVLKFDGWGVDMLVQQLYDKSKAVSLLALDVLDEAAEDEANLSALVFMRPSVLHLGNRGSMLMVRFLSTLSGYKYLTNSNFVSRELTKWNKTFNIRYVSMVEQQMNDSLTSHQVADGGSFSRRSSVKQELKDVFVPVHLYGQMARHQEGFEELTAQTHVNTMLRTLRHARFSNEQDIIELKAALWALCHLGSTVRGVELLIDRAVIPDVIKLAEECPLYSVRGTCFYGLGLVASTQRGVEVLQQLGWESLSHPRHVAWPVTQSTDMREPSVQDRGLRSRTLSEASSTALSDITTTGGGGGCLGGGGGGGEQGRQQDTLELPDACFYIGSNNPSPALDGVEYFIDDDVRGYTANGDMIQSRRHGDTSPQFSASFSADGPIFTKDRNYLPRTQTLPAGGVASSGSGGPRATHQRGSTELLARDRVDSAGSSSSGAGRRRRSGVTMLPVDSAAAAAARLHAGGPSHARSASDVVHITYTQPKLGGKPRSESMREDANKGDVNSSNGPRHLDSSSVDSAIYDHSSLTKNRVNGSGVDSATCSNGGALRKPRSDSCGNESTSGVSSSDSIPFSDVAPTPGSTPGSVTSGALSGLTAHPSDVRRKQANLRRKASVMRQMSHSSDNTDITFTSSRDALGYAVLRNLQRHRTSSQTSDMTPAAAMDAGHHQSSMSVLDLVQAKTRSLDTSTSVASIRKLSISSMPEQVAILSRSSSSAIKAQLEPSGGPEYIGLCVPVDVGVIFHDEEEDNLMRSFSTSFTQSLLSDDASLHEADFARQFSKAGSEASTSDGLEYHTSATCLGCLKIYRRHGSLVVTRDSFINRKVDRETAEFLDLPMAADLAEDAADADQQMTASSKDQLDVPQAGSRSHGNSSVTVSIEVVTPRSCASLESSDSGMRRMTVDSHEGRVAIRREVLKYIVNMSSSVAVKSAEQGLLTLKQRFPPAFQDLCLYSELAHLLATCRFRLSARRFLQELFQDATFAELYDDPRALLAIDDDELPSTAEET